MKVSIIGVTGYSGLELLRLLLLHPQVEVVSLHRSTKEVEEIDDLYPHLRHLTDLKVEPADPEKIMKKADLVFFATSSGIAKDLADPFIQADFPVIDLSGDHRLTTEAYREWYKKDPAKAENLKQAHYGLAEFADPKVGNYLLDPAANAHKANLIANPGCYATTTMLGLAPLVQKDLIEMDSIIVDAKSGLSGAGKKLSNASHYVEAHDNMSMYKLNHHQHIPEIVQQLHAWNENVHHIQFSTSLIPVTRGIFASIYAKVKKGVTPEQLNEAYTNVYHDKYFVRVHPYGTLPQIKNVVGSNFCDLGLDYNTETGFVTVVSVIDNLVKGAAGQAIQNLNLWAGWPEQTGLELAPLFP